MFRRAIARFVARIKWASVAGQTTAEYALVMLGAVAIATVLRLRGSQLGCRLAYGRAGANAVLGAERFFGFGSGALWTAPHAGLLREVVYAGMTWRLSH